MTNTTRHTLILSVLLMQFVSFPSPSHGANMEGSQVRLGQLQMMSTPSPGRVGALDSLAAEVTQRTSIEVRSGSLSTDAQSDGLFESPLLFLTCNAPLSPPALKEQNRLAQWLRMGGQLIVDWQGGGSQLEEFRTSLGKFLSSVLPGHSLERIPRGAVIYRSFYRLKYASGRIRLVDDLYGIKSGGRYVVIVSFNDLLSAVQRDKHGEFVHNVVPGGARQREQATRLLVNLVAYALCLDYKDDKVHLDYLKSRRNWRLPGDDE